MEFVIIEAAAFEIVNMLTDFTSYVAFGEIISTEFID